MINSTCPCCGYITLSERGGYEICPICFWEDDPYQFSEPDYQGGANRVSLREAQQNFVAFGACELEAVRRVKKPASSDKRDPDWNPL